MTARVYHSSPRTPIEGNGIMSAAGVRVMKSSLWT